MRGFYSRAVLCSVLYKRQFYNGREKNEDSSGCLQGEQFFDHVREGEDCHLDGVGKHRIWPDMEH